MKVLIAFDNSDASKEALKYGLKFKSLIDEYYIVYVTPTVIGAGPTFDSYVPPSVYQKQEETAEAIISEAREILEPEHVNASFLKLDASGDQVAKVIIKTARENGVDFILTGTRKLSGLSKMLLGSVSSEIVKLSEIPIMVVPPKFEE